MARFIRVEDIPASLWETSVLHLPPQLASIWESLLEEKHLKNKAIQPAPEKLAGGITEEETNNFFAWRFPRSSVSVMITLLDPQQDLHGISDVFIELFSGNKVFLADLPCGAGAASLSILSTLCELRKKKKIPRMPLHVTLLGGDISIYAQEYAQKALEALKNNLAAQAITLDFKITYWNVCDRISNVNFIRSMILDGHDCSASLLFLANFSDFLEKQKKWQDAQPQINHLFDFGSTTNNKKSAVIWIEPETNIVVCEGGFFQRLQRWFKSKFGKILREASNDHDFSCSTVRVKNPMRDHIFKVNSAVIRFNLSAKHRV